MNHGPYIKLIAGFLLTSLAFMVSWKGWAQGTAWGWLWGRSGGWEHVVDEPELPQAEGGGCGLVPSVNGRFLPLPALGLQLGGDRRDPPDPRLPFPQLLEGNFALFCTYTLGFRNEFQNILLAIMVGMALSWGGWGCGGVQWVLPGSWCGMGAPRAEGREAHGTRPQVQ